jgi:hypothetical protein
MCLNSGCPCTNKTLQEHINKLSAGEWGFQDFLTRGMYMTRVMHAMSLRSQSLLFAAYSTCLLKVMLNAF